MCGINCLSCFKCMLLWEIISLIKKKKILGQNKFNHIKLRLLQFLQMLLILIMNKNVPLHPNSSYYQMCISKRQKSDIIIIIIRQPKLVS